MNFTEEQRQAVFLRDQDILVSAGAGAGKTRVLVSRMAELMMDPGNPVSADQFLVMTFTSAAAAEMKERIRKELENRIEQDPENGYLRKQARKLKHADISTVHSFCNHMIRTHFNEAGIDPSFRIGEEGEMKLLKQQALDELMEREYQEGRQEFLDFAEAYSPEKDDRQVVQMIESAYHFSRSFADSRRWAEDMERMLCSLSDRDGFLSSPFAREMTDRARETAARWKQKMEVQKDCFLPESELGKFFQVWKNDLAIADRILACEDYDSMQLCMNQYVFDPAPRKSKKLDWQYHPLWKSTRDSFKKELDKLRDQSFYASSRQLSEETGKLRPFIQELLRLTMDYEQLYFQHKKERNVYDFDDLEHLTLHLLVDHYDEDGKPVRTSVAEGLVHRYREIFVDEYQDTNLVQETLIQVLHDPTQNHLFTVGDVKQSIYRFRQARPDLFMNRYDRYRALYSDTAEGIRIELRDNFRSAPKVLEFCNLIFRALMRRDFGGVDYTEEVALRAGEGGPMASVSDVSEVHLLIDDEEKDELTVETERISSESAMIAARIRELLKEGYTYRDMVILLRTGSGWAEPMADCLNRWGIPAVTESKTGYFQSREVSLVLSYLSVIDNVYQDIPMASVLLSSIGGFTEEDLTEIELSVDITMRWQYSLYEYLTFYLEQGPAGERKEKIRRFLIMLNQFREEKREVPLHELLWDIYQKTGIYYNVMLLPEGERRRENLRMLLKKAEDYEKTVFKGLFYFLRYMEQLKTYEIDFGMASAAAGIDNAVHIMTIHKSKGLEFPVVFLSGLSKGFNQREERDGMLLHPSLGIGMQYVDLEEREKSDSFLKQAIRLRLHAEAMEEELRVLYVAMTRAQNKVILTGIVEEEQLQELADGHHPDKQMAKSMMDWILGVLSDTEPFLNVLHSRRNLTDDDSVVREEMTEKSAVSVSAKQAEDSQEDSCYQLRLWHYHEIRESLEMTEETNASPGLEEYLEAHRDTADSAAVSKTFAYEYPYREETELKRKYSISELKRLSQTALPEEFPGESLLEEYVPENVKRTENEAGLKGASRGTVIHKIFERLPFGAITDRDALRDELRELKDRIPEMKQLNANQVYRGLEGFLFSETGRALCKMDREGKVRKEQQFTVGLPAFRVNPETDSEERIVLQGIIDCYAETDQGILLLDYKTDYVTEGNEEILLDRYQKQMLYYKMALEQITGKQVTQILIYSFGLRKLIPVICEDI